MLDESDLHEYQQRMIDRMYDYDRSIMVVPMGGGKTVTAATAFSALQRDGLLGCTWVFAPKRVALDVWGVEFTNWAHLHRLRVSMVVGTPTQRLKAIKAPADFYVTNYDNLQWLDETLGALPANTGVVFDEITRLKNPRGKRAKAALRLVARTTHRVGLTGTPKPKDHHDLFMQALIVKGPKLWGSNYFVWRAKHFVAYDYDQRDWQPKPGEGAVLDAQFAAQCYTVTNEELGRAYVEPALRYHYVTLPKAAQAAHDKALRGWLLDVPGLGAKQLLANAAVGSGKARQIASGFVYDESKSVIVAHREKIDLLKEMVDDLGEPAMIAYEFLSELAALRETFPGLRVIGAGVSDAEVSQTVLDWNAGRVDVLAIHPASAGHGLNLQYGGRHLFWFTLPWPLEYHRQTIARLARQGQTQPVFVHHIVARGTVEEQLVLPRLQERGDAEDNLKALIASVTANERQ